MRTEPAKSKTLDMTSGSIIRLLITFSLPLLLGNLFQQLYNTVDSLVVGNFVGKEALAAVGSTTSIVNTLVKFFNGVSIGAGVIISQYYGSRDDERLHCAVETTIALTLILSVIMTVIGCVIAPWMLELMSTPDDVLEAASTYLRIYFAGISGLLIYNMGTGILRAVGDTTRPLYFLCLSTLLNIILDLLFVLVFRMGVAGVAYATIIAQFISGVLVLALLTRSRENFYLSWRDLKLDAGILRQILSIGLPAGLQQAITAFSNVFVQSYINRFGSTCMAGWSTFTKIDQFIMLPIQSVAQAATTFVGQNAGARNIRRAKKGSMAALSISLTITASVGALLWIFAPAMASLFNRSQDVVSYGVLFIRLCSPLTLCCCFNQVLAGSLRGVGDARTPMIIMLTAQVLFRQLYLLVATSLSDSVKVVGFGYPAGWIICCVLMSSYYFFGGWEKRLTTERSE